MQIYMLAPMKMTLTVGLAPATALKTPSRAMQRIASNPDNPRTVHLSAG